MNIESATQIKWLKSLLQSEEALKESLAMQLHSDILPDLAVIKINLQLLNREKGMTSGMKEHIDRNSQVIDNLIEKIREFYQTLYPSVMRHIGFVNFIRHELNEIAEKHSCNIQFQTNWEFEQHPISKTSRLHLFRLIRELLEYVVLNKPKSTIEVYLKNIGTELMFECIFKNVPFSHGQLNNGNTLFITNINARLLLLNAIVDSKTDFENYFKVSIPFEIPQK